MKQEICNVYRVTSERERKNPESLTGIEPIDFCEPVGYCNH